MCSEYNDILILNEQLNGKADTIINVTSSSNIKLFKEHFGSPIP